MMYGNTGPSFGNHDLEPRINGESNEEYKTRITAEQRERFEIAPEGTKIRTRQVRESTKNFNEVVEGLVIYQ